MRAVPGKADRPGHAAPGFTRGCPREKMPLRLHALRTLGADAGELQDGLLSVGTRVAGHAVLMCSCSCSGSPPQALHEAPSSVHECMQTLRPSCPLEEIRADPDLVNSVAAFLWVCDTRRPIGQEALWSRTAWCKRPRGCHRSVPGWSPAAAREGDRRQQSHYLVEMPWRAIGHARNWRLCPHARVLRWITQICGRRHA